MNIPDWFRDPQGFKFGPRRVIGVQYTGDNKNNEIPQLWEKTFMPRVQEIIVPEGIQECYGICRCLPGRPAGQFEYVAGKAAADDAPLPDGMLEVTIPESYYLSFEVPGLDKIHEAWDYAMDWFAKHPEVEGFCTPLTCECATSPCFEFYPPDFDGTLYLYFPIKH